jgi:hypothetical protein
MEVFKPRFSITGWIITVGLVILVLLFFWKAWGVEKKEHFLFPIVVGILVILFLVDVFFLAIYPTMRYEIGTDALRLVCRPFSWTIPYPEIKEIVKTNLEYHLTFTLICWQWPGYTIGKGYYADRGRVRMCATSMCENITLIKTDKSLYGVTPRDEGAFVNALKERMK